MAKKEKKSKPVTEKKPSKFIGGVTGKGFSVDRQPTPEAKRAGWERRRQAQALMDTLLSMQSMTLEELQQMRVGFEEHPERYTIIQKKLLEYISDDKNTVDFLDRHISKAPVQQQLVDEDGNDAKPVILIGGSLKD